MTVRTHTPAFISRDPMVTTNRSPYGYADGNPLNCTDPSGMLDLPFGLCLRDPFGGENDNRGRHTLIGTGQALHVGTFVGGAVASALVLRFLNKACGELVAEDAGSLSGALCKITFGHGERHLVETGLEQGEVKSTIKSQVQQSVSGAVSTGSSWVRVVVNGQIIEYRAYTLPNGAVNVGTYYVVP